MLRMDPQFDGAIRRARCTASASSPSEKIRSAAFSYTLRHIYTMKIALWSLAAAASAPLLASAAPPFVLQNGQPGAAALFDEAASSAEPAVHRVQDLTVDEFQAVQHALKDSLERAVDSATHLIQDTFGLAAADDDDEPVSGNELPRPHFPSHPLPPPVIDLKEYTVFEIVNASLEHHHHRCGHHRGDSEPDAEEEHHMVRRKIRKGLAALFRPTEGGDHDGDEHKPDPSHLPLHRLAWLANFSSEAGDLLKQDGPITLLAPDDAALTPPHRGHGRGGHHAHSAPPGRRPDGPPGRRGPRRVPKGESYSSPSSGPGQSFSQISSLVNYLQ